MYDRLCPCAAAADALKCRSTWLFRGGPHRALPTEVFRLNTVGRVLRAPPRLTGKPLPTSVGGRCPLRPADRRKRSYILHRQRQRRRGRDDTKFRTRPTETLLADRKGSQETIRFLAHLWLLSVRTESNPPGAWTRRFYHQFPPKEPDRCGHRPLQILWIKI